MKTRHLAVTAIVIAALAAGSGCGDDGPTEPNAVPGTLQLRLTTPYADDGAIMLEIRGPEIDRLAAVNSAHLMYSRATSGSAVRVVIVGDIRSTGLLEFQVPDVRAVGDYSTQLIEVADRTNELRSRLSEYEVLISDPNI